MPDAVLPDGALPDAVCEESVADPMTVVARLQAQGVLDSRVIAEFQAKHDADTAVIAGFHLRGQRDSQEIAKLRAQRDIDLDVIALLEADGILARDKNTNLEIALQTSRRIGAAIGIIMAMEKVTELDAFDKIRHASQHGNRKVRDVAEDVLSIGALFGGRTSS